MKNRTGGGDKSGEPEEPNYSSHAKPLDFALR